MARPHPFSGIATARMAGKLPVRPRDPAGRASCPPSAASLPKLRRSRPAVEFADAQPSRHGTVGTLTDLDRAALSIGLSDAQTSRRIRFEGVHRWLRHFGVASSRPLANERLEALRLFAFDYAREDSPPGAIRRASGVDAHQLQQARAYCADRLGMIDAPAVHRRDISSWTLVLIIVIGVFLVVQ